MRYILWEEFKNLVVEAPGGALSTRKTQNVPPDVMGYAGKLWYKQRDMKNGSPTPGATPAGITQNGRFVPWNPKDPNQTKIYQQTLGKTANSRLARKHGRAVTPAAHLSPEDQKKIMQRDIKKSNGKRVKPQKLTHITAGGDADVKQFVIEKGFSGSSEFKVPAPGTASSAFNEIVTGETVHLLLNNPDLIESPHDIAKKLYQKYHNTGLGKELMNGNIIKKGDGYGLDRGLYSKCYITAMSGIKDYNGVMNSIETMGWPKDMVNVNHFYGSFDSQLGMLEELESANKVYSSSGEEIDVDFARELVETMGGGQNSSDTAIFIKNHNGDIAIKFISNKQTTEDIQANSSLRQEMVEAENIINKINLNEEDKAHALKILTTANKKLEKLNTQAKGGLLGISEYFLSNPEALEKLHREMLTKNPKDPNRQQYYKDIIEKFFSDEIARKEGKAGKTVRTYLQMAGWNPGEKISTAVKLKAFLHYAGTSEATGNAKKLLARSAANIPGIPSPNEQIGVIKKKIIDTQFRTIKSLDKILIGGKIPLGKFIESQNLRDKFHLDAGFEDTNKPIFKTSGLFSVNMGGVEVGKKQIQHCLNSKSVQDFIRSLAITKIKYKKDTGGDITGADAILYRLDKDGKQIPFAYRTVRNKGGVGTPMETTYKWHKNIQNCFKENQ